MIALFLLCCFGLVVAFNVIILFYEDTLHEISGHYSFLMYQFYLDEEANVMTWASSMLLLLCGIGCGLLSWKHAGTKSIVAKLLIVMALGFVFLSMDDTAQIHGYVEDVVSGDPDTGYGADDDEDD